MLQELGLIPTPKTAAATAAFLKSTLLLDKSMLGEYLSRGPADKYPFNAQVCARGMLVSNNFQTNRSIDQYFLIRYAAFDLRSVLWVLLPCPVPFAPCG